MTATRLAGRSDGVAEVAISAGLGLLMAIGFAASYQTLRDLAASAAGFSPWLAPVVPLSFDLGIVVLSLKVVLATREGRTATVMRALVVTLAAATVAANATAADTVTGRLLHAVPPAMFVICFESVVVTARRRALERLELQPPRLPRARLMLWLLAPAATWRSWRGAVLAVGHHPGGQGSRPAAATVAPTAPTPAIATVTSSATDSFHEGPDRRAVAVTVLRRSPDITAASLAEELRRHGHAVSVRTAQRIRADAQDHIARTAGDGEAA